MNTTAFKFAHDYNLMEDYLHAEQRALASDLTDRMVSLQYELPTTHGSGAADEAMVVATELLTVDAENRLLHLSPDPTSHTGWSGSAYTVQRPSLPNPSPSASPDIDKLLAVTLGEGPDRTVMALVHFGLNDGTHQVVPLERMSGGDWQTIPMKNDPDMENALGQMRQTDVFTSAMGESYIYGVSEGLDGIFRVVKVTRQASGRIELTLVYGQGSPTPDTTYRLLPGLDGAALTVMTLTGTRATFTPLLPGDPILTADTSAETTHDFGLGKLTSERIEILADTADETDFVIQTDTGALIHIANYMAEAPTAAALTGGAGPVAVARVSVGRDVTGRWMLLATETETGALHILRQTKDPKPGPVAFDAWSNLRSPYAAMTCPRKMIAGAEVFAYDVSARLRHLRQDLSTGIWHVSDLETAPPPNSTQKPKHTSSYVHEITLQDQNGLPVPSRLVSVTTDAKVVMLVNGFSYHVGPKQPARVETDEEGQVVVRIEASGLTSPAIHVAVPGTQSTETFSADHRVRWRMSGQDSNVVVDGKGLVDRGLWPMQIPASDANPDDAAAQLRQLGKAALSMGAKEPGADPRPTAVEFFGWGGFKNALGSAVHAGEHIVHDVEKGAKDLAGDIIHGVKHAAKEIDQIAVKIEKDAVTMVIDGTQLALDTASQVMDAVEAVVQKIASFIKTAIKTVIEIAETLIDWMRYLLDFGDIVKTKDVLKTSLDGYLKVIGATLKTDGPKAIAKGLGGLKAKVNEAFDKLDEVLPDNDATFQSLGIASPAPPAFLGSGSQALNGGALRDFASEAKVQSNFVRHHAKSKLKDLGCPVDVPDAGSLTADIQAMLKDAQDKAPLKNVLDLVTDLADPLAFLAMSVRKLIAAMKDLFDLAIDLLGGILERLLEFSGDVVEAFRSMLMHTIHVPLISDLYKAIVGSDLCWMDLFCLLLAAPVTVIYKLVDDGAAPFTDSQHEALTGKSAAWSQAGELANARKAQYARDPGSVTPLTADSAFNAYRQTFGRGGDGVSHAAVMAAGRHTRSKDLNLGFGITLGVVWVALTATDMFSDAVFVAGGPAVGGGIGLVPQVMSVTATALQLIDSGILFDDIGTTPFGIELVVTEAVLSGIGPVLSMALAGRPGLAVGLPLLITILGGIRWYVVAGFSIWQIYRYEESDKDKRVRAVVEGTAVAGALIPPLVQCCKLLRYAGYAVEADEVPFVALIQLFGGATLLGVDELNFGTAAMKITSDVARRSGDS